MAFISKKKSDFDMNSMNLSLPLSLQTKDKTNPENILQTNSMYSFLNASETLLISRFTNFLTRKGKKSKAEFLLQKSFQILSEMNKSSQLPSQKKSEETMLPKVSTIFAIAIKNTQPLFEVRKVRIAGTTYQVPSLLNKKRQEFKAMNWLLESAYLRKKKTSSQNFEYCLALEIWDAYQKQGYARQKRNELHKLVEANRAFSHFRWW